MKRKVNAIIVPSPDKFYRTCILFLFLVGTATACDSSGMNILTPSAVTPLPPSPVVVELKPQCELSLAERLQQPDVSYGVHNNNNDLSLSDEHDGTLIPLPQAVIEKIHELAFTHFQNYGLQDTCSKLADVYGSVVYQIDTPQDSQLFVLKLTSPPNILTYYLILFDPTQNHLTPIPPGISGNPACSHSQCNLLEAPYIGFDDINQDGEVEIVFQRQAHNGTFNAAQYLYYDIAPDLALTTIFVLETRVPHPREVDLIYIRNVQRLQPNRLLVKTYLLNSVTQVVIEELGFVILEAPNDSAPFSVISKTSTIPDNREWLVTFTPYEEDNFLRGVLKQR